MEIKKSALPLSSTGDRQQADVERKLRDAARMYEGQFLREMVKAMRGTVPEGGMMQVSQAEKIFRDQLDNEYADRWSEHGGVGLSDFIYEQLLDRYGASLGLKPQSLRPVGPVHFRPQDKVHEQSWRQTNAQPFTVQTQLQGINSSDLVNPWDGKVGQIKNLLGDYRLLEVHHDNGLASEFVFRGQPQVRVGERHMAGSLLGTQISGLGSLAWSLRESPVGKKNALGPFVSE